MVGQWSATKPSRSNEVLDADEQERIAELFHIGANTSICHNTSLFLSLFFPEFLKLSFTVVSSNPQAVISDEPPKDVADEFMETQYYKELYFIDEQHHTICHLSNFKSNQVPTSLPSMATPQPLLRKSSHFSVTLRSFATTAKPSHHNDHKRNHKFLEPNSFIGSWEAPKDPKEAEARLAQLRRDYAKQVKEVRKAYIQEMELMRLEKQRKDDARREAIRVANEERKKLKAEVAKVKAEERKIAQEEFRQTLLKERADKLETWSRMMRKHEEKKKEKKELLHKQSSMWIDESELEKKVLEAIVDRKLL
ncbi:hypothetical protein K1719_001346 [Acacia pycnantha]|nr:hypothetical protein K1719_001346 [Acacia pycnantha]